MPPSVVVRPPESPLTEGLPDVLEVEVRAGDRAAILDSLRFEGAQGGESWRRRPSGLVLYDARADRYGLLTVTQAVASVPISTAILPPGRAVTAYVPIRILGAGEAKVTAVVSYRELEARDLPDRLYLNKNETGVRANPLIFKRGREHAAATVTTPPASAIVRETGLELLEARVELSLRVDEDATAPGRAVPGRVIGRSTALGNAWLVEDTPGVRVLLEGGAVRVDADAAVFLALDALRGEGLRALFRGQRASRVCEALQGESGELIPALVAPERLRALVELAGRAGARLRVGRPWEGVVIE